MIVKRYILQNNPVSYTHLDVYKRQGESIGKAIGEVRGEERRSVLINKLILDKRNDEIQIVVTDAKKRRQYYDEYGL